MSTPEESPNLWMFVVIPLLFFTIFPLFWCFVVWLISHVGGWSRLARQYKTASPVEGRGLRSQFGQVGIANYKGTLNLSVTEGGVFMETMVLFRVAHPRLFIPWEDMHDLKPRNYLWKRLIRVEVGNPTIATLTLPEAVFEGRSGPPPLPA